MIVRKKVEEWEKFYPKIKEKYEWWVMSKRKRVEKMYSIKNNVQTIRFIKQQLIKHRFVEKFIPKDGYVCPSNLNRKYSKVQGGKNISSFQFLAHLNK